QQVAADHVPGARSQAADGVVAAGVFQADAGADAGDGGIAAGVGADVVALDDVEIRSVPDRDAAEVGPADHVAGAHNAVHGSVIIVVAADDGAGGTAVQANAQCGVAEAAGARRVDADVVARDTGAGGARAGDGDAVPVIAADDVAGTRCGAADDGPTGAGADGHSVVGIAGVEVPNGVSADQVAGDGVAIGELRRRQYQQRSVRQRR